MGHTRRQRVWHSRGWGCARLREKQLLLQNFINIPAPKKHCFAAGSYDSFYAVFRHCKSLNLICWVSVFGRSIQVPASIRPSDFYLNWLNSGQI
jgi:hypothetical protein